MNRVRRKKGFSFIRAALILFVLLLAIYIPLKIHIARSGTAGDAGTDDTAFSIFVTSDLKLFREPCG
jgi:hypothetical protein